MNKKLYRDEYHKVLGGVCSGLAEYFDMDVTVIRLLFAFTVIIMGVGIVPYIVLWIVLPKKGYPYNVYNNPNSYNNPSVDYTVPPQQPEGEFTYQGNPFGGSPYVNNPFTNAPFQDLKPKQKSNAGVIVGLVLIIVGAAILIDEFDLIPDFDFDRVWPAILVVVGAALIISGQKRHAWHSDNWQDTDKKETVINDTPESTDDTQTV